MPGSCRVPQTIVFVAGQVSVLIGVTGLPSCHTLLSDLLESLLWILLIFTILHRAAPVAPPSLFLPVLNTIAVLLLYPSGSGAAPPCSSSCPREQS